MGNAEVAVPPVGVIEVPGLARVNRLVAAGAGGVAGVDERGDGGSAALVVVTPAAPGRFAGRFASAVRHQAALRCLGRSRLTSGP